MRKSRKREFLDNLVLPEITDLEIGVVSEWLHSREHSQRRPDATAKLLVLICKLYQTNTPWPSRRQVAGHLGISMPLIDIALSQRQAEELIKVVIATQQGSIKQRDSVITHKFIWPGAELDAVYKSIPHHGVTAGAINTVENDTASVTKKPATARVRRRPAKDAVDE